MSTNFLKYIFIHVEIVVMLLTFIVGVICAASGEFLLGLAFIAVPFVYGHVIDFEKHLTFIEIYERAWNIKLLN